MRKRRSGSAGVESSVIAGKLTYLRQRTRMLAVMLLFIASCSDANTFITHPARVTTRAVGGRHKVSVRGSEAPRTRFRHLVARHADTGAVSAVQSLELVNQSNEPIAVYVVVQGQRTRVVSQLNPNEQRMLTLTTRMLDASGAVTLYIRPMTGEPVSTDPIQAHTQLTLSVRYTGFGQGWSVGLRNPE